LIKAVFFDFDGVLTRDKTGSLTTLRYLSARTGIPYERLQGAFGKYNEDLNLGKATHAGIWPQVCKALGCRIDPSLLREAFESTPMNAGMLQLARALKPRYSVGIITDNKKDRIDCLKEHAGLAALFDPIVVSAEVGASKASTPIFECALSHLGIAPQQSVFIDNSRANLVAPNALGMNTVYFDDDRNDVGALVETLKRMHGVQAAST
jgi:putative hydrolase of the HAD superfamily